MKNVKPILKKVRSLTNSDIYYTYSNWEAKEIKGLVEEGDKNKRRSMAVLSGWYKSAYWKKKSFN